MPILLKFLKPPVALLRFFKRGGSRCKMGSADLKEPAATPQRKIGMRIAGVPCICLPPR
jgi:hypothetical protein